MLSIGLVVSYPKEKARKSVRSVNGNPLKPSIGSAGVKLCSVCQTARDNEQSMRYIIVVAAKTVIYANPWFMLLLMDLMSQKKIL